MDGKQIARQLLERRKKWVEVEAASGDKPAKRVQFSRPPEADFPSMLSRDGDGSVWQVDGEHVRKYVCGWDGYTEADIIGASGASDAQPFDPELFGVVVSDDVQLTGKIARAILDSVIEHIKSKEAVAGN